MMYLLKVKIFSTEAALVDTSNPCSHVFSEMGAFVPCNVENTDQSKDPFHGFTWGSSVVAFLQVQKDLVLD